MSKEDSIISIFHDSKHEGIPDFNIKDAAFDRAILQIKYRALKDYGDEIYNNLLPIFLTLDKEEQRAFLKHAFIALKYKNHEEVMGTPTKDTIEEEIDMMQLNNKKDMRDFKIFFFKVASIFIGIITTLIFVLTFEPKIPWIKEIIQVVNEIKEM